MITGLETKGVYLYLAITSKPNGTNSIRLGN